MIALGEQQSEGVLPSLRRLADTVIGIVHNRIELLGIELKEEKSRLLGVLIWGIIGVFLAMMTVVTLTMTVVLFFWEHARWVMAGFTAFYLIAAVTAVLVAKSRIKNPPPFAETVSQLKKDRAWLKTLK